jgi:hypothetical protein
VVSGLKAIGSFSVGGGPTYGAYDGRNGYVYVPNSNSDNVSVIFGTASPGWIAGTVSPADASVTINETVVPVSAGTFNQSFPGGTYSIRATLFGYSMFERTVLISPDAVTVVDISLTNLGWIAGTVTPITGVISVNLQPQTVTYGAFNITELASDLTHHQAFMNYTVSAAAIGYVSQTRAVTVTPGNVSRIAVVLQATPKTTYAVMFAETGLPNGTNWSVTLNGTTRTSASAGIVFVEPNGTYAYDVAPPAGYSFNGSRTGNVTVNGKSVSISVGFWSENLLTYALMFEASGLPAGTNWSVTLTATSSGLVLETLASLTRWSYGSSSIIFHVSAGDYAYSASAPGYSVAPGTDEVSGGFGSTVGLAFAPDAGSHSGPPNLLLAGWTMAIGIALLVLGASGLSATAYRYRARERERGRVAVAQIFAASWVLDEHGQPAQSKSR